MNSRHTFFVYFWTIGGYYTAIALAIAVGAGALVSAGTSIYEGQQTKGAIESQQQQLAALQYQPIDINALITQGQQVAAQNAANSLQLERTLEPQLGATRSTLPGQIQSNLALNGNLPADVRNQATQATLAQAGSSGGLGSGAAVPATAATLGTTALNLQQLFQGQAQNELNANPLPQSGLDPGSVASATLANNANQNQFNLAKAGGQASLTQSLGQANANEVGGVGGALAGGLSSYTGLSTLQGLVNGPTGYTGTPGNVGTPGATTYVTATNQPTFYSPITGAAVANQASGAPP